MASSSDMDQHWLLESECGIRVVEQAADFGEGLGEILAHADFLSALTSEEENCGE
jgi:hypothetical protein